MTMEEELTYYKRLSEAYKKQYQAVSCKSPMLLTQATNELEQLEKEKTNETIKSEQFIRKNGKERITEYIKMIEELLKVI